MKDTYHHHLAPPKPHLLVVVSTFKCSPADSTLLVGFLLACPQDTPCHLLGPLGRGFLHLGLLVLTGPPVNSSDPQYSEAPLGHTQNSIGLQGRVDLLDLPQGKLIGLRE